MQYPFGYVDDENKEAIKEWNLIHDEMLPIMELYKSPDITDIFVDRYDNINVMRNGVLEKTKKVFASEAALVSLLQQFCVTLDQDSLDLKAPILDARLPDGSRINATHISTTPSGSTLSLRKVTVDPLTVDDFINSGMMTPEILDYLIDVINRKDTFLISGNMGSGKTSIMRFLAEYIDKRERVVTAEDTQELHIHRLFPYGLAMEAPNRNESPVDLPALIHATLRQQPDRVLVGELRKAPAVDAFMQIIYTGVRGCGSTIHGKSCKHALSRIQYLLASAGNVSFELTGVLLRDAIDVIIQTHRDPKWGRRITEIARLVEGELQLIFKFNTETGVHERIG
ncbi:CpaF family protein [Enterobacter sp. CM29]|uniref:CpaF family protein n=1 Tax=Enterobacter sp. CM29 TaxID=2738449 RepID=UPI0015586932|nr:ATPase, T2SS/T4P/T4SS family [Enterobacter sp. CM29]NQD63308.1 CpaF family protein [Enterobacter sp. CM29]